MSTSPNACFSRVVTARSAADGSTSPDGWLCDTITAAALHRSACLRKV